MGGDWWGQHRSLVQSTRLWKNVSAQLPTRCANQDKYRKDQSGGLDQASYGGNASNGIVEPPTLRRFCWLLISGVGGFLICLWGGIRLIDDERHLFGVTLLVVGLLLLASGFFLWWATY
jgi:hypothetical protein